MIDLRLSEAAKRGDTDAVLSLLDGGKALGTDEGQLALLWAAASGHAETVRVLIELGADVNAVGQRGHTALGVAAAEGQAEIVQLLLEKGATIRDVDLVPAAGKDDQTVRLLLDCGANVNVADDTGRTPLMQAVIKGRVETVRLLLERAADVNAENKDGYTVLRFAKVRQHSEIIDLFTSAGSEE